MYPSLSFLNSFFSHSYNKYQYQKINNDTMRVYSSMPSDHTSIHMATTTGEESI